MAGTSSGRPEQGWFPNEARLVRMAPVFSLTSCRSDSATSRPIPSMGGTSVSPNGVGRSCGEDTSVTVPQQANICGSLSFTALRAPDTHFHKCPSGREAILGNGPDVNPGVCPGGAIEAAGIVSGITSADRVGYLVGVCLPARVPDVPPPPHPDFEGSHEFARLVPVLAQLFIRGDGRPETGSSSASRSRPCDPALSRDRGRQRVPRCARLHDDNSGELQGSGSSRPPILGDLGVNGLESGGRSERSTFR